MKNILNLISVATTGVPAHAVVPLWNTCLSIALGVAVAGLAIWFIYSRAGLIRRIRDLEKESDEKAMHDVNNKQNDTDSPARVAAKKQVPADDTPKTKQLTRAEQALLNRIDKIIADNIASSDFGVDFIIERIAISRSVFYSRFKEITGMTIGAYINDFKVRFAKKMLENPALSINDISYRLGFKSQRYFSTFFKEHTGMSPTAFRSHEP
ncbi:MAG: helix-turn-helix transcriptional regulator [Muribaculaceae bacterium]|nr:helix-turn-helix transcriptional regulator [Muribaculaceae bacterium]